MSNTATRPSYDAWLHGCLYFVAAAKCSARTDAKLDTKVIFFANGLDQVVQPMLAQRFKDQEHDKFAPPTADVEADIRSIHNYLFEHFDTLSSLANSERLPAMIACQLVNNLIPEAAGLEGTRRTNVLNMDEMQAEMNSTMHEVMRRESSGQRLN